ncbi:unnamed protein product [Paramecium octaurelia]|uniref:Transmembrane protein n=1 Tax=Paramecium octaurelia TaxID=43137 RepID=A0A8S1XVP2_PAROT|nr:unnamed protein product [Paramecium octaurelia]
MTKVLYLSFLLRTVLTDYIFLLKSSQPFIQTEFSILGEKYQDESIYRQGAWFQYLPLTSTIYSQSIGMIDSNCYHLFSSVEKQSQSLNSLYYDCLDLEQMTITKYIKFIGNDAQQYSFEININVLEYENQWYYFEFILFLFSNRSQLIIIKNEEVLKNDIVNVLPFKDERIIQQIGGDLVVVNSKIVNIGIGDKFAIFPGKIVPISYNDTIMDFVSCAIELIKFDKACICQNNPTSNLQNQDYVYLNTSIYTSKLKNCNYFTFTGWFKINEIIQNDKEMTFQFIKLTSNMQNRQFQNQNISPLQLYYKLTQDENKIIITTYSYTYPSVTLDFTNDPFLIRKEFQILNNIQLWHLLYLTLDESKLDFNIKFFENREIYEYKTQIIVKHFHQIYFKLFLGNLQKSTTNYLNIMSRNLHFFNCDQNFQQQNCHKSCDECDGPTNQNCLSCSIESQRIYFREYQQCLCPFNTIDYNDECLSYAYFGFQLNSNAEQDDGCKYGQFELNGICYQCPGQQNSQTIACLECVLNPKDWISNPYCDIFLYLDQNGRTSQFQKESFQSIHRHYFTFNGIDLELCRKCQESSLTNQENIYQDLAIKQESFKSFCFSESYVQQCYDCSIEKCNLCALLITGQICLQCSSYSILVDGYCTGIYVGDFQVNDCLSPYYISSSKECKKCLIDNCIYCFEFVVDNLKLATLYFDFKEFNGDDNFQVGCAMCNDGYVFDFRIGLCLKQTPKIDTCLRSYINLEGIELCTLSSKQDFSVAREIIDCEQFISNCLQCFLTVQSILRCILCKEGYTTSTSEVNGQCNLSLRPYQLISIEGNVYSMDAWVQRIQSFMGSFLPNSYYYPISEWSFQSDEIAISCKERYQLILFKYCLQYCNSSCQDCKVNSAENGYFCNKCPLDYFKQNQRVQVNGICQSCSLLCTYCQSRDNNEINQISTYFISSQDTELFSKKCYFPTQDPNIILLPKQLIPIFCLDKYCQNTLIYDYYSEDCVHDQIITSNLLNQATIKYLNYVGVLKIIIQIEISTTIQICENGIWIDSRLLKQNVFSFQETDLIINGNNIVYGNVINYEIKNFDSIVLSNLTIILQNYSFNFGNTKVKLTMKNIIFIGKEMDQNAPLLYSKYLSSIELVNITIRNVTFSEASFIQLDTLQFSGYMRIEQLLIQDSYFFNSNFILILNSQLSMQIKKLVIENCTLMNSSIINIRQNLFFNNLNHLSTFIMKNCNLQQSNFYM